MSCLWARVKTHASGPRYQDPLQDPCLRVRIRCKIHVPIRVSASFSSGPYTKFVYASGPSVKPMFLDPCLSIRTSANMPQDPTLQNPCPRIESDARSMNPPASISIPQHPSLWALNKIHAFESCGAFALWKLRRGSGGMDLPDNLEIEILQRARRHGFCRGRGVGIEEWVRRRMTRRYRGPEAWILHNYPKEDPQTWVLRKNPEVLVFEGFWNMDLVWSCAAALYRTLKDGPCRDPERWTG